MNAITNTVSREEASETLSRVILNGDLSHLSPQEKVTHYKAVCQSMGLNPLTQPFGYLRLSGKEVLYAKRDCTDQLRAMRQVSVEIVDRTLDAGLCIVTARATLPNGRRDEEIGAVALDNLRGEARANAIMKAITKSKRRVTLSICGLGFLDETEISSIEGAEPREVPNLEPSHPKPPPPSGSLREYASEIVAARQTFPVLSPAGDLHRVPQHRWLEAVRRAVTGLEDAVALRAWCEAMEPHLAEVRAADEALGHLAEQEVAGRIVHLAGPPMDEELDQPEALEPEEIGA